MSGVDPAGGIASFGGVAAPVVAISDRTDNSQATIAAAAATDASSSSGTVLKPATSPSGSETRNGGADGNDKRDLQPPPGNGVEFRIQRQPDSIGYYVIVEASKGTEVLYTLPPGYLEDAKRTAKPESSIALTQSLLA